MIKSMKFLLGIEFAHDYDSDLYMISGDANANQWKVTVCCENGKEYYPSVSKFYAYPGCETHEGKAAWLVEYYRPKEIKIQIKNQETVIIKHPDASK